MDITCSNCGAANRNTSRFCARCGEALPAADNATKQNGEALNLPWLQGVQEKAIKQTGELSAERLAEVEALRAAKAAPPPAKEPVADEPAPAAPANQAQPEASHDVPDQAADQPPTVAASPDQAASATEEGSPDEPPPDWVVGILEPDTAAGTAAGPPSGYLDETYEPEEMAHIMPWLNDEQGAPGEAAKTKLPSWLGDVTVQETIQARDAEVGGAATEDLLLDVEGLEPFIPPQIQEKAQADATADVLAEKYDRGPKVPEWLKTLAPAAKIAEETEEDVFPKHGTPITRIRLDPSDIGGAPSVGEVQVRPPRAGSVETLTALLQNPARDMAHQATGEDTTYLTRLPGEATSTRTGMVRWLMPDGLIYIVVLAVLLAVLLLKLPFGQSVAPAAPGVQEFYAAVEAAPQSKPVLLVYDWDAGMSAEMSSLAAAITHHVMSRRLNFVTISTIPQGPGFAQQITAAAADDYGYEYGQDYIVLGYVPGNEAALGSLVTSFDTLLPLDYVQSRKIDSFYIMRGSKLKSLNDFGLIIDLSSDESALRNWVEQATTRTQVPMVAAVPQGLEALALPYKTLAGGQPGAGLKAVMSGQAGALQYIQQLTSARRTTSAQYSTSAMEDRLNAQSVAQLLVALAILGAFAILVSRMVMGGSK